MNRPPSQKWYKAHMRLSDEFSKVDFVELAYGLNISHEDLRKIQHDMTIYYFKLHYEKTLGCTSVAKHPPVLTYLEMQCVSKKALYSNACIDTAWYNEALARTANLCFEIYKDFQAVGGYFDNVKGSPTKKWVNHWKKHHVEGTEANSGLVSHEVSLSGSKRSVHDHAGDMGCDTSEQQNSDNSADMSRESGSTFALSNKRRSECHDAAVSLKKRRIDDPINLRKEGDSAVVPSGKRRLEDNGTTASSKKQKLDTPKKRELEYATSDTSSYRHSKRQRMDDGVSRGPKDVDTADESGPVDTGENYAIDQAQSNKRLLESDEANNDNVPSKRICLPIRTT